MQLRHRLFNSYFKSARKFNTNHDVVKTPNNIHELYRVQEPQSFFTFVTLILGVFASSQPKHMQGRDIVKHQKSTRFVGSTNKMEVANSLETSWKRGSILTIDTKFLNGYTIDVGQTIQRTGTDFFTKINEHEHCMTLLPLSAIKSIRLNETGIEIPNPFYINSDNENAVEDFKEVYQFHMHFLQTMFESGFNMGAEKRQKEINELVPAYNTFYKKYLGNINPYDMKVSEFRECFGNNYFGNSVKWLPDMSIKELILNNGDYFFTYCPKYRLLLQKKKMEEYDDGTYERRSYQYE